MNLENYKDSHRVKLNFVLIFNNDQAIGNSPQAKNSRK